MTFSKPDGVIVISGSGCCCPPGGRHRGMHTNSGTNWWRVDRGDGGKARWHNVSHSITHALTVAAAAMTCDEFVEEMMKS